MELVRVYVEVCGRENQVYLVKNPTKIASSRFCIPAVHYCSDGFTFLVPSRHVVRCLHVMWSAIGRKDDNTKFSSCEGVVNASATLTR